jgi:hypothetical protein
MSLSWHRSHPAPRDRGLLLRIIARPPPPAPRAPYSRTSRCRPSGAPGPARGSRRVRGAERQCCDREHPGPGLCGMAAMVRIRQGELRRRTEVRLDRVGPGGVGRGEAQSTSGVKGWRPRPQRDQAGQADLVEPVDHITHGVFVGLDQVGNHRHPVPAGPGQHHRAPVPHRTGAAPAHDLRQFLPSWPVSLRTRTGSATAPPAIGSANPCGHSTGQRRPIHLPVRALAQT